MGKNEELTEKAVIKLEEGILKDPYIKSSIAYLAVVDEEEDVVVISNKACHAGLRHPPTRSNPILVVNRLQDSQSKGGKTIGEARDSYLEWLLNHSPWRNTFISKDAKNTSKLGYTVSTTHSPHNFMVPGLIATRELSERPRVSQNWFELVQLGVHPDLAFIASYFFSRESEGDNVAFNIVHSHCAVNASVFDRGGIKRFLNHNPIIEGEHYYSYRTYDGLDNTWGTYKDEKVLQLYRDLHSLAENMKSDKKVSANVFMAARTVKTYDYKNYLKEVSSYLKDMYEEFKGESYESISA